MSLVLNNRALINTVYSDTYISILWFLVAWLEAPRYDAKGGGFNITIGQPTNDKLSVKSAVNGYCSEIMASVLNLTCK